MDGPAPSLAPVPDLLLEVRPDSDGLIRICVHAGAQPAWLPDEARAQSTPLCGAVRAAVRATSASCDAAGLFWSTEEDAHRALAAARRELGGLRLRVLRRRLSLTQDEVAARTVEAAARLNQRAHTDRYHPIHRSTLSAYESGRLAAELDRTRAVLAAAYGVSRDALADYIDGVITLTQVIHARERRAWAHRRTVTLGEFGGWERLREEGLRIDPELTHETFEEMRAMCFIARPVEKADGFLIAQLGRALQSWHARCGVIAADAGSGFLAPVLFPATEVG